MAVDRGRWTYIKETKEIVLKSELETWVRRNHAFLPCIIFRHAQELTRSISIVELQKCSLKKHKKRSEQKDETTHTN